MARLPRSEGVSEVDTQWGRLRAQSTPVSLKLDSMMHRLPSMMGFKTFYSPFLWRLSERRWKRALSGSSEPHEIMERVVWLHLSALISRVRQ